MPKHVIAAGTPVYYNEMYENGGWVVLIDCVATPLCECVVGRDFPDAKESCEACRYWMRDVVGTVGYAPCRRYPPLYIGEYGCQLFPNVRHDEWCGEFQSKAQPEDS